MTTPPILARSSPVAAGMSSGTTAGTWTGTTTASTFPASAEVYPLWHPVNVWADVPNGTIWVAERRFTVSWPSTTSNLTFGGLVTTNQLVSIIVPYGASTSGTFVSGIVRYTLLKTNGLAQGVIECVISNTGGASVQPNYNVIGSPGNTFTPAAGATFQFQANWSATNTNINAGLLKFYRIPGNTTGSGQMGSFPQLPVR